MAYEGGGLSAIWKPDLTTRAGAISAVNSAKFGFLIIGAFRLFGYATILFAAFNGGIQNGSVSGLFFGIMLLDIILPLVTAWRLHPLKGAYITPITTVVYVIGILSSLNIVPIVIGAIFTGAFVSGIRGAWALKRDTGFDDDIVDTFA